jgi:peptidoglycan/xylan/chitin deacetylase (PgdA/CDA1 family)
MMRRLKTLAQSLTRRVRPSPPSPVILMYHRIARESFDPWGLAVDPSRFDRQLDWLRRHRTLLPLPELARLHAGGALPQDAVAITFDDAYACSATVAAPMLTRRGIPATIMVPDLTGRAGEFWWDELEHLVLEHDGRVLSAAGVTVTLGPKSPRDRIWPPGKPPRTARQSAFHQLWSSFRKMAPQPLERAMEELRAQSGARTPRDSHRRMSVEEARALSAAGVEFGSHTLTHASLPALTSAQKAKEVGDSMARCEALTGQAPKSLAYPFGDYDAECEQLASAFGYTCACTTEHRAIKPDTRLFALPRLHVRNLSTPRFAAMLGAP